MKVLKTYKQLFENTKKYSKYSHLQYSTMVDNLLEIHFGKSSNIFDVDVWDIKDDISIIDKNGEWLLAELDPTFTGLGVKVKKEIYSTTISDDDITTLVEIAKEIKNGKNYNETDIYKNAIIKKNTDKYNI